MSDTLKPCPFCGNDAILNEYRARKGYEASIQCSQCSASIVSITYDTQQEATEKVVVEWNCRAYEDVKPVVRGEWICYDQPMAGNPYCSYACTRCGDRVPYRENYCPNCGADMRERSKTK